jgi:MSHA biogenesis protein MshG
MQAYSWRGRNQYGGEITGVIDAGDEASVAQWMVANGVTPVQIVAKARSGLSTPRLDWHSAVLSRPITHEDLLLFFRQMYTLQRAGVPILRSFAGLQASTTKPAIAALLADLREGLNQGRDLATSMTRHTSVFSAFFVSMVRVGEMTGSLTDVFRRLSEHIEFEMDVRARVKDALRYPAMVVLAMAVALVVINLFVLPTFASVFQGFKAELPLMTRVLLGFSAFTVRWWPLLLGLTLLTVWGVRMWIATPSGRYRWDSWKLRLPVVGPIVLKATLARFARSLSIASSSGVPISQAMAVVALTVDNAFIGQRIEQMRDGVERGEDIARCAAATGVFTPVVLQIMSVGEETGELDALLIEVAEMYERETDYAIKGLSAAIEPLLLLIIGGLVLVLALGVFLPLWSMGQAASGRG